MPHIQTNATLFGLLRHGKTVWNVEKRIQGSGNSALTAEGIATCEQWAQFLSTMSPKWSRIVVSPLQRTLDTAAIVNKWLNLPIHQDDGLREQNWGLWEGLTLPEIKTSFPEELEKRIMRGWDFRAPKGESRKEVLKRTTSSLKENSAKWPGENLLLITHLGVIKSLLYYVEGRDFLPEEPKIVWKNRFQTISSTDGNLAIVKKNISLPTLP